MDFFLFSLQKIMRLGFDWDTSDMSILLHAKLAMAIGNARIIINSLHIKGDVCNTTILPLLNLKIYDIVESAYRLVHA